MSADRFWSASNKVVVSRYGKAHFVPDNGYGYTACGIALHVRSWRDVPVGHLERAPYEPCRRCYPKDPPA